MWDYLTLTVSRASLRSKDEHGDVQRYVHGARTLDDARAMPTDVLDWLLPGHDLTPGPFFEPKGWQGYKQSTTIHAPGIASPVGLIAREGNADTVCVSITGAGMFAVNLHRAALALEHYGVRITRIDAAFDDLDGRLSDMENLRRAAAAGMFDGCRSRPSAKQFVDDMGTGSGCSLYVGRKGDKQLNVYEKGKQLGNPNDPHVRYEARLWAKNRHLPYSMLASPLSAILGAYPRLRAWLPDNAAPSRAKTMRRRVEADAGAMVGWLQMAAGKSIGMLRDAAREAGATDSEILDLLSREGMPDRFGGVPDVIAIHRTAEYLQGKIV